MDATGWAALTTAASAVVVAWQAWETRRTAQAAEDALVVAREDLSAAQDSLTLAARTLETTRAQHLDSVRARLDGRAPRVRVYSEEAKWPPREPSPHGDPQPFPSDTQFRTPRDESHRVMLRVEGFVKNEGDVTAEININPPLRPVTAEGLFAPYGYPVRLEPGNAVTIVLEEDRPLRQWMDNWNDRQAGRPESAVILGQITCSDPYNDGVVDRWTIEMSGTPVRPIQGDAGGWELNPANPGSAATVWARVRAQERLYYLDKEQNVPLPAE